MRLRLDTHVALWAIAKPGRLPRAVTALISDPGNDVVVSAVSLWEIAIKHALARGRPDDIATSTEQALTFFRLAGYDLLGISPDHAVAAERLPRLHADPFDRLLLAQALIEPLRLITHDVAVTAYSDTIMAF